MGLPTGSADYCKYLVALLGALGVVPQADYGECPSAWDFRGYGNTLRSPASGVGWNFMPDGLTSLAWPTTLDHVYVMVLPG